MRTSSTCRVTDIPGRRRAAKMIRWQMQKKILAAIIMTILLALLNVACSGSYATSKSSLAYAQSTQLASGTSITDASTAQQAATATQTQLPGQDAPMVSPAGANQASSSAPLLCKMETPEVYLVFDDTRHHIVDWDTFLNLGYKQGQITACGSMFQYPEGNPITRLLKGSSDPVYWMENGLRRHIPDIDTFLALGYHQEDITQVPDDLLNTWPLGEPLASQTPVTSTETLEDLLARDVQDRLAAYPRPQPFQSGQSPSQQEQEEWSHYRDGLAAALSALFSDSRAQSLSASSLATIFSNASGLPVATYSGPGDLTLASFVGAFPEVRIGGGGSPYTPSDAIYVLNRQHGIWLVGLVDGTADAAWVEDHWVAIVSRTRYGSGLSYEVWHISGADWKPETMFKFGKLYGWPEPHLSPDGQTATLYTDGMLQCTSNVTPVPCEIPDNLCSHDIVAWDYVWQDGQYQCKQRYIFATATPSP
jgi:hypothetical protein